jgi:hypothetical protein
MLKVAYIDADAEPGAVNALGEQACSLRTRLVSSGYALRTRHHVACDKASGRVNIAMLLAGLDAVERSRVDPRVAGDWEGFARAARRVLPARVVNAAGTESTTYLRDGPWPALTLVCDPILGAPSFVSQDTREVIGAYRLALAAPTLEALWRWERQYDAVYALWMASAEYEAWAEAELTDAGSDLNRLGAAVARDAARELGVQVAYELHQA